MASTQKKNGKHEKTDHGEKAQRHPEKAPAYVPDLMARGLARRCASSWPLWWCWEWLAYTRWSPICCAAASAASLAMAFWLTALALFWAAGLLLLRRERRATLRLWCLGLLPVVGGAFLQCCSRPGSLPWGLIWQAGSGTMGSMALAAV